jgi:UDP-N-acetylglucosamine 1-carboxyvinyltransferase
MEETLNTILPFHTCILSLFGTKNKSKSALRKGAARKMHVLMWTAWRTRFPFFNVTRRLTGLFQSNAFQHYFQGSDLQKTDSSSSCFEGVKTRQACQGAKEALKPEAYSQKGEFMDRIRITGGKPLSGTIPIAGAKNAALPLIIASLLTDETLTLHNVPRLNDVVTLSRILGNHGVDYSVSGKKPGQSRDTGATVHLKAKEIIDLTAPYDLVRRMRASFWVIGPLLARMGQARVSLPGGCAIGSRPVNFFLDGLSALGADIEVERGYAIAKAPQGLRGNVITLPHISVGATHVLMMAASLAKGETVIHNAAAEPEVADLADCLNKMGARIEGAGTHTITIEGVPSLSGCEHHVLPDRIETGTYAMAVAMTGGDILLQNTRNTLLAKALETLEETGASVTCEQEGLRIRRNGSGIRPVHVTTEPFPGFSHRSSGPVYGPDDHGGRDKPDHRNHF